MDDAVMFDELDFLSLSSLLSIYERQREPESKATPSDEEGISSGDEELNDENDSIVPNELSVSSPERQLTKFLDSISETFSRTKSIPLAQKPRYIQRRKGNKKEEGASQVSASGLIMIQHKPTVYIAKNEGTDD